MRYGLQEAGTKRAGVNVNPHAVQEVSSENEVGT
jgi:hypothetical protein